MDLRDGEPIPGRVTLACDMRRKLLAAGNLVKQRGFRSWALLGSLSFSVACGGAPPVPRKPDPYGPRIADCVDRPRPLSDAAHGKMVRVAAGPAVQGSTSQERAQARADFGAGAGATLFEDEGRVRRAYVHGFRMDLRPVTNALYAEFVEACGVLPPDPETISEVRWEAQRQRFGVQRGYAKIQHFLWIGGRPIETRERHPAVLVSQDEAAFYCAWRGGRLPSEQEWERAARGPSGNVYPWGNRYDPFRVNTALRGQRDTIEVGALPQGNTPEGFTDMGGHVFEWTSTPWPGRPGFVVVKGNGWDGPGGYGRGAARVGLPADLKNVTLGFRCAAD
jgi:toxoflavin biosynthesis protein ToxD